MLLARLLGWLLRAVADASLALDERRRRLRLGPPGGLPADLCDSDGPPRRCGLCGDLLNPEKPHRHGLVTVYGSETGTVAVMEVDP